MGNSYEEWKEAVSWSGNIVVMRGENWKSIPLSDKSSILLIDIIAFEVHTNLEYFWL